MDCSRASECRSLLQLERVESFPLQPEIVGLGLVALVSVHLLSNYYHSFLSSWCFGKLSVFSDTLPRHLFLYIMFII